MAAAVAMLVLAACSGPDAALVEDLEATGLTLHAPDLRGSDPVAVEAADGKVRVAYDEDGYGLYTLEIAPAPVGELCRGIDFERGSSCDGDEDTMVASFEEMTVVAVRRDDVVLVARGLVTEADATLVDDAVAALREAPQVSAAELAGSVA
ncbi:hypothetical protein GCM10009623_32050 [Nocardioides aestuarii]